MKGQTYKRCAEHGNTGVDGIPACRKDHGSWYFRADGEKNTRTGRRRQVNKGGFRIRDDAQDALTKHLASIGAGTYADDEGMTLGQWFDLWLAQLAEKGRAKRTLTTYRSHIENVLRPALGDERLRDIRRRDIDTMLRRAVHPDHGSLPSRDELAAEGREKCPQIKDNGEPCKNWKVWGGDFCGAHGGKPAEVRSNGGRRVAKREPGTLDSYRRTLRSCLSAAQRQGRIQVNHARGELDSIPTVRPRRGKAWEPEDAAKFLAGVQGDDLEAMWEIATFYGQRRGELIGIARSDIDLTSARKGFEIHQTVSDLAGPQDCALCGGVHRGWQIKGLELTGELGTKGERGERWQPLVGTIPASLAAHFARQDEHIKAWRDEDLPYRDHGLAFCQANGDALRPDWVTKRHGELCEELGLPRIRLHDMRHGAASLLLMAGVTRETVAMILGHDPAVTMKTYAHQLHGPAADAITAAMTLVLGEGGSIRGGLRSTG